MDASQPADTRDSGSRGAADTSPPVDTPDSRRGTSTPSPGDALGASDGASREHSDARAEGGIDADRVDAHRVDELPPTATGTIAYFPATGGGVVNPVAADMQMTYFQTLPDNRDVRRGIVEFRTSDLPADRTVARATLQVHSNVPGNGPTPVIYYRILVSHFPGDLVVTMADYDHPSVDVAEFEAPGDHIELDGGGHPGWKLDVTAAIQGYVARHENVTFRFRLEDEDMPGGSGGTSLAGSDSPEGPLLIVDWGDTPSGTAPP